MTFRSQVTMAKLSEINNLPYYPAFALLFVVIGITLSCVSNVVIDHTLLRKIYPSTQPLSVTNNDGTLSNGDKLRGWRKTTYFIASGLLWMITCLIATIVLVRLWPGASTNLENTNEMKQQK